MGIYPPPWSNNLCASSDSITSIVIVFTAPKLTYNSKFINWNLQTASDVDRMERALYNTRTRVAMVSSVPL